MARDLFVLNVVRTLPINNTSLLHAKHQALKLAVLEPFVSAGGLAIGLKNMPLAAVLGYVGMAADQRQVAWAADSCTARPGTQLLGSEFRIWDLTVLENSVDRSSPGCAYKGCGSNSPGPCSRQLRGEVGLLQASLPVCAASIAYRPAQDLIADIQSSLPRFQTDPRLTEGC